MRPAVFLDRDGTLIEEVGYLNRLDRVSFFPWSIGAVRALNDAGLLVIVVTNQAGVAQGYYDEAFVRRTHERIDAQLKAGGARIDAYYYCPHHPNAKVEAYRQACECRKPMPGMIRQAAADLDVDAGRSFVVGDRWGDVQFAHAAGARSILVRTGYADPGEPRPSAVDAPDYVADNLAGAVCWILRRHERSSRSEDQ